MSLTSAKKTENNTYELELTVDAAAFEAAVNKAYRKNVGRINVPGFRKGKAPKSIIEKMYGADVFYDDALNDVFPAAYEEAVKESGIEPVDRPDVEVVSVDKEAGVQLKVSVTVKPEVTLKNYKGVEVEKKAVEVTEEDITRELGRLQERGARLVTVDDRAAQNGDIVDIDFEGSVDGVNFEGGKAEHYELTLGSGSFIPGFEDQVVGHSTGEEFDIHVSFPEDYQAEELKGKNATFHIKLHEIKYRELPALDDEFAKDVSEFDTLEELKADLSKHILEAKEHQAEEEMENAILDKIVEEMEVDLPRCMIEHRIDEIVQDFNYRLQSQGMNLDMYLKYTGSNLSVFRKTFEISAEHQVKVRLALEKIVELEKLEATEAELEEKYAEMAKQYGIEAEKIKNFAPEEDVSRDICMNKAVDLVKAEAKITEGDKKPAKKAAAKKPAAKKTAAKKEGEAEEGEAKPKKTTTRKTAAKKDKAEEAKAEPAKEE